MSLVTRTLIAKELYVNRWLCAGAALGAVAAAVMAGSGETAFSIGAITWITVVIALGVMLAIYGVMQERKEQTLQFVLSLPLSPREYVWAKLCGLLLSFLLPWLVASAAATALVLLSPRVPDGLLPYVLLFCGYLLANFAVVLGGALLVRSEGLMVGLVILTNMSVSLFMTVVTALPGIKNHLGGATPAWNATFFQALLVEVLILVLAIVLPLLTAARRRDFL